VVATSRYCIHLEVNAASPKHWYFSIIYASPQLGHREETWEELRQFNSTISGPWCLAGDYNTVLFDHEKIGGAHANRHSCEAFENCINDCNLLDLGYAGSTFTWNRGQLYERLDRVLCNPTWQYLFPDSTIAHLPLPTSDHCGLWIQMTGSRHHNNKPFKFMAPWLDHPDFNNQVLNSWHNSFNWIDNINNTSSKLREWNRDVLGNIFKRKERILRRLEGINRQLQNNHIERLIILRDELWGEYNVIVKQEEVYWQHQSHTKWLTLGDKNTRFFHMSALQRRRKNKIAALQDNNGQWIYEENALQNLMVNFYKNLYSSSHIIDTDFPTYQTFPTIKEDDLNLLKSEITIEETKHALFSMGNLKSPGPDGFHPVFFKSQWDIVGTALHKLVVNCFLDPNHIEEINNTRITLIPKCEDPSMANQFRPIALCNVAYKVVTKVLTQRLRMIMPYIISQNQSSFIPGRSTVDNILVLQESIQTLSHMHGQKGYMIIKLDLEKAYDRLEWNFIEDTLMKLQLPHQLISLIMKCISPNSLSLNWNGSITDSFKSSRGLRQGDPISPYL
ncbi:RNA-directed DNA polymerase (Reverse transcriptase), partial [Trifolium medium]|nr:RNA-directed DNA polymerase (Reverse transcriptase) [Trifolium medium]